MYKIMDIARLRGILIRLKRLRRALSKAGDMIYLSRHRQPPPERVPDFLIIGAMKSGTTELHHCLSQHPDIFMSYVKEPSYFLGGSIWLQQNPHIGSFDALRKLMYRGYAQQKRVGESSTSYTEAPTVGTEAPANIFGTTSDMQFIYIVRNPFARIVSHYLHCVELGIYSEPLNDVIRQDKTFLERSLYFAQIARYLEYFDKERFLVLVFEEFIKSPDTVLEQVFQFLGVSGTYAKNIVLKRKNRTIPSPVSRLSDTRLDKATYALLHGPIMDDVRSLCIFMNRDIDHWDLSEERWCSAN